MNVCLTKLRELLQKNKILFEDYRFSAGSAVLASVFEAAVEILEYDFDWNFPFDEEIILRFLIFFCVAALFTESCLQGKRLWKLWGMIWSAVFAGTAAFFISLKRDGVIWGVSNAVLQARVRELTVGGIFLLLTLTVYFSYRKTHIRFEEYALKLFFHLLELLSVYLILTIGVGMVTGIFDALLLGGRSSIVSAGMILVTGITLVPGGILALHSMEDAPGEFLRFLVQDVFGSLTICALGVVYLYVLSILFTRELPSNEIFPILSVLFCIGMPVWVMSGCWNPDGENPYFRILTVLPYVFAPLILMQILAAGIRIGANGLTPDRYAAVMLILFEIGTLLIWHFRRDRLENVLLLLSVLLVVTFFVPVINRYRLSVLWQQSWLQKYYEDVQEGKQLSPREYERLNGAYHYLSGKIPGNSAAEIYDIEQEDFAVRLAEQDPKGLGLTQYDRYHIHGCQLVGTLDMKGFCTMSMVNRADINLNEETVDFTDFVFVIRETGEEIHMDISEFVRKSMEYIEDHPDAGEEEQRAFMRNFYRMELDSDTVFYMNHFEVSYNMGIRDGEDYFEWMNIGTIGGMLVLRK